MSGSETGSGTAEAMIWPAKRAAMAAATMVDLKSILSIWLLKLKVECFERLFNDFAVKL